MRIFLNHIQNEPLDEIKTSLENLWQRMIQLSEIFQYSFALILKRKCLVGASRSAAGRVVLLQLLSIHGGAVGVTNLDVMLLWFFQYSFMLILKRKCLVGASRVRCGESGTPSTIIYTRWSSRRYELGCDAPMVFPILIRAHSETEVSGWS